jgi:hypothetical protein
MSVSLESALQSSDTGSANYCLVYAVEWKSWYMSKLPAVNSFGSKNASTVVAKSYRTDVAAS